MTNEISFKQNIKFVDYYTIQKLIQNRAKEIDFMPGSPLYVQGKRFYTWGVKTCAAGGFSNSQKQAVGFHLLDCYENYEQIDNHCKKIYSAIKNPTSGILIGSKTHLLAKYSLPIFSKMEDFFSEKIAHFSVFREHSHRSGRSCFMYDSETDTWNILAQWCDLLCNVSSIEDLKNFYKEIIIAEGDKVFIEDTEIDPKDIIQSYPDLKNQ